MGMFSWDCSRCGHPLLGPAALDPDGMNAWMGDSVALSKRGDRIVGEYDGYGRLDSADLMEIAGDPEVYHAACYELAGRPEFERPSRSSADQGYFFALAAHSIPDPRGENRP